MTATRLAVDLYINVNIVLGFVGLAWLAVRVLTAHGRFGADYVLQLGILKTLLVLVVASPVLALAATACLDVLLPGRSVVLSDLAVAAYLQGDIAMDAIRFETFLNTRDLWTKSLVGLDTPVAAIVAGLAAAGVTLFALRFALAARSIRQMLADSHAWKRIGSVEIRLSSEIAVPLATRWGFTRYVVLPSDLVTRQRDLRFALAHELQHFRQRDIEWEIGFELIRPLFFWNPAFTFLKLQFDRLRELTCDQAVVASRRFDRGDYARCLIRFCEITGGRDRTALNVALVRPGRWRAKRELTGRVLALQSRARPGRFGIPHMALCGTVSAVAVGLASASIQPPKDWSHDRLMLSTVVNLERLEVINRGFGSPAIR